MEIPQRDLYQFSQDKLRDLQMEASQRRIAKESKGVVPTNGFGKFQSVVMFIGTALLPLRESLRSPISERRSLDIST